MLLICNINPEISSRFTRMKMLFNQVDFLKRWNPKLSPAARDSSSNFSGEITTLLLSDLILLAPFPPLLLVPRRHCTALHNMYHNKIYCIAHQCLPLPLLITFLYSILCRISCLQPQHNLLQMIIPWRHTLKAHLLYPPPSVLLPENLLLQFGFCTFPFAGTLSSC